MLADREYNENPKSGRARGDALVLAASMVGVSVAVPRVAAPLLRYWWHSAPERYARAVLGHSRLIATRLDEHMALAREAEATDLLRPIGWLQLYATAVGLERAMSRADGVRREFGVNCVPPGR